MGVGTSTGLNASSTAYAVNTDVNNRQLHPDEFDVIQIIAEKLGVNEEELKKAILYHVDKGWQDNIAEKEAEKIATYQDLYRQALVELNGRSINGYYLDDLYNMQDVDLEPSNVTGRQSSENETYDAPHVTLEPLNVVADRDFEADKTNLYLKQEGMAFNATNDDFNNGRIFAAKSFNEIQYNFPSLVKDMSVFEKLQETSDGFVAFSKGIAEGGVSSIKDLADAIINLPNVDISAVRERAYKLSSDTIKYLTDSQYRDSVNQEAVYDLKTDIAYGQILALQGDADKIGQAVGEATGNLVADLAISATTVGVGKVAGQTVKIVGGKSNDGNPNLPDVYGDGDLPNVSNYGNPNTPADRTIADKKTIDGSTGTHNPHYDTKHGAYTSLKDQYDRAMTGYSPNLGVTNHKVDNASKFFNSTDMEYAMREAERLYALNPSAYTTYKPDGTIKQITVPIDFNRPVGEGYIKNNKTTQANGTAGEYRWTNSVSVGLDKTTKKPYTAFPDIDKGIKKPDPLKVR